MKFINSKIFVIFLLFSKSVRCLIIECRFSNVIWTGEQLYSCWTQSLTDLDDPRIQRITGTHIAGKTNQDVEAIFRLEEMKYFPPNLLEYFGNLKAISWWNSTFTTISSSDLMNFKNLKHLYIPYNKFISSLPADLFKHNTNLEFVQFKGLPNLQHIVENLLGNLTKLAYADFSKNGCIDELAQGLGNVKALNFRLRDLCPPEIETCPSTCLSEIKDMRNLIQKQDEKLDEISILETRVDEKEEIIQNMIDRIEQLEILMRGISHCT